MLIVRRITVQNVTCLLHWSFEFPHVPAYITISMRLSYTRITCYFWCCCIIHLVKGILIKNLDCQSNPTVYTYYIYRGNVLFTMRTWINYWNLKIFEILPMKVKHIFCSGKVMSSCNPIRELIKIRFEIYICARGLNKSQFAARKLPCYASIALSCNSTKVFTQ